ncbi:MAG: ribbon-helix-helix domain-containing protein [Thermoleophilia bacterium]
MADKPNKKKPMQVYLDYKQDAELSFVADKLNISKAEVIRRSLDEYLIEAIPLEDDPLMEMIGLAGEDSTAPPDGSENHDYYLAKWEQERWMKE